MHDLNERDANEIWVLLSKNGIPATKVKAEKNQAVTWTIKVKDDDEQSARSLLVANNLPRVRQGGLEALCGIKVGSFILTPKQEKCREILGLKGEIINNLEKIPGVVSADVVLNLPEKEDFPDEDTPTPRPTASVVVQYLDNGLTVNKLTEGKVQEFVARSVDGLDARDVAVIISFLNYDQNSGKMVAKNGDTGGDDGGTGAGSDTGKDDGGQDGGDGVLTSSVMGLNMDTESAGKFKLAAGMFLLLFLLLAVALIFVLYRMSKLRKQAPVPAEKIDPDQKLLEA